MYTIDINKEDLEEMMNEIEDLQNKVAYILYNKNPLVRFFYMKKARKMHEQANMKMLELFYPTFKKIKKDLKNL